MFEALLNRTPTPPGEINPQIPEKLEEVIGKALEKDRELRYQSAAELRTDLRRIWRKLESGRATARTVVTGPVVVPQVRRRWHRWALVGGAVVVIALMAVLGIQLRIGFPVRENEPPHEIKQRQLTFNPSESRLIHAAISPDGKMLAYTAANGVFLQIIATGETRPLNLPGELGSLVRDVTWFPDGTKLLLNIVKSAEDFARANIWSLSILGGSPHKLHDGNVLWSEASPDGTRIAFYENPSDQGRETWVMGADGENPRKIRDAAQIASEGLTWSPDSQRVLVPRWTGTEGSSDGALEAVSLAGGSPSTILTIPGAEWVWPCWAPDGRILYAVLESSGGGVSLWEVRADLSAGRPLGQPRRIAHEAGVRQHPHLSLSGDGKRMAVVKTIRQTDVYVGDFQAGGLQLSNVHRLTLDERDDAPNSWTADGKAVLFTSNRRGDNDIFVQRLDEQSAEAIASGPGDQASPVLTPDGEWILYTTPGEEKKGELPERSLMRVRSSGGPPEFVMKLADADVLCASRPGGGCVLNRSDQGKKVFLAFDPLKGAGRELVRVDSPQGFQSWDLAPDGRRVALGSSESRIWITSLDNGRSEEVPLKGLRGDEVDLSWTADGSGFIVTTGLSIWHVDLRGNATKLLGNPRAQAYLHPVPSRDGRHLAFPVVSWDANVWLVEGF